MLRLGPTEWNLRGDLAGEIVAAGVRLKVLGWRNEEEMDRRRVDGPPAGALARRQLIALSTLPHGHPVPWAEIDLETRLELDSLPQGAIRACDRWVTRIWRPPIDVRAVQLDAAWRSDAVEAVSLFAVVAPRVVRVADRALCASRLLVRAAELGVGVYLDADRLAALTDPPSRRHVCDDARRWELAEALYAASGLTARARLSPAAT